MLTGKYRTGSEGRLTDWAGFVVQKGDIDHKSAVVDAVLEVTKETGLPRR